MRILYATLGAGNGHLSRAEELIPHLQKYGEVDIAVSGTDAQVKLAERIQHQHHGLIFHLGKRGGIDYWRTFRDLKLQSLLRDIRDFPIRKYDCVVNDFEPITARSAKRTSIPIVSLSHQASFASKNTPRPKNSFSTVPAEMILKRYAPCDQKIGLHFQPYDDFIRTPVIRKSVRNLTADNDGHITVYLPAFDDAYLMELFEKIPQKRWELFSKRSNREVISKNTVVRPISLDAYTRSLGSCDGLLTGGGFEAPAEALFLGKKLLMVPQAGQYEQQCNAAAAARLGVTVLKTVNMDSLSKIGEWVDQGSNMRIEFPDHADKLVAEALEKMS